jgi:hypothetical protein
MQSTRAHILVLLCSALRPLSLTPCDGLQLDVETTTDLLQCPFLGSSNLPPNPAKSYKIKTLLFVGPVAQRLEQRTHNPLVPGSNPGGPTNSVLLTS